MRHDPAPLLLDVTRLVAHSWTGRRATGIDRVCQAYLERFHGDAHAVIQHRGVVRTLNRAYSRALFDMLIDDRPGFRARIAAFTPRALTLGAAAVPGATYLNVGHTDFDLNAHARWVGQHALSAVYLIHDLIPVLQTGHCRPHAVRRHRGRVLGALRHGAGIVTTSAAVAHDLAGFASDQALVVPPVTVAPLAGAVLPRSTSGEAVAGDHFLCIGTIETRKNHLLLLRIWQRLLARRGAATPRLVIVGQWGSGSGPVRTLLDRNPALRRHVTVVERCSDAQLGTLLNGARVVLMPSLAEGFGLPMAEALTAGVPIIATDLPCFREVGQGIPRLVEPGDEAAWEALIDAYDTQHPDHRRQMARLPSYRPTTWDDHFARVIPWLETLVTARGEWHVAA